MFLFISMFCRKEIKSDYRNPDDFRALRSALQKHFQKYFPSQDSKKMYWIREPFSATPHEDFSTAEEKQFVDATLDSSMRLQFKSKTKLFRLRQV